MEQINYIFDGEDFATVNASGVRLISTALPQGAVDYYNPSMVKDNWYRYFESGVIAVTSPLNNLRISSSAANPQCGIMQKLAGLTKGSIYSIEINMDTNFFLGKTSIYIYSGTVFQSKHSIINASKQKIQFIANSNEDTIVIDSEFLTTFNRLSINSIKVFDTTPSIQFAPGLVVKPLAVSGFGVVKFTSGRDSTGAIVEVNPNQAQCEAYGYSYNNTTGTCSAYTFNQNVQRVVNNENNRTFGLGNIAGFGTNNNLVMGQTNTIGAYSRNNLITGQSNQIAESVNNASVSGFKGEATVSGSVVLGGNAPGDSLGKRQFIRCIYAAQTTSNSSVSSTLNNEDGVRFVIPDNTIIYFHAETVVVRTGGTNAAGAVGDYGSYVERGVIINKSGTTTIQRERDTIKTSGTVTNWRILAETGGSAGQILKLSCRGQTNMILEWCMNVSITQIKTGVTL